MIDREKTISSLKEIADYFHECRSNASFGSKAEEHFWELQSAANDARELLEKQVPKPPRIHQTVNKIFYACDRCGKSLFVIVDSGTLNASSIFPKFCSECGQAVKWDEFEIQR